MRKKPPLTDEQILEIYEMDKRGVSGLEIARETGHGKCAIDSALARVSPSGRVMQTMYGDRKNDPSRNTRFNKTVFVEDTPIPTFKPGRNAVEI